MFNSSPSCQGVVKGNACAPTQYLGVGGGGASSDLGGHLHAIARPTHRIKSKEPKQGRVTLDRRVLSRSHIGLLQRHDVPSNLGVP
jgi:hypothetical protein